MVERLVAEGVLTHGHLLDGVVAGLEDEQHRGGTQRRRQPPCARHHPHLQHRTVLRMIIMMRIMMLMIMVLVVMIMNSVKSALAKLAMTRKRNVCGG